MMKAKKLDMSQYKNSYQFPLISLMTILWIFFLALYIQAVEEIGKSAAVQAEKLAEVVREDLKDVKNVKITVVNNDVKIVLPNSILFGFSSARLKKSIIPTLKKFSASINTLEPSYMLEVRGYTDNTPVFYGGEFSSNWELSLYRAISVIDFLIKDGWDPNRFVATGMGEYGALYPNDTPLHRARNRRVEIYIKKRKVKDIGLPKLESKKLYRA